MRTLCGDPSVDSAVMDRYAKGSDCRIKSVGYCFLSIKTAFLQNIYFEILTSIGVKNVMLSWTPPADMMNEVRVAVNSTAVCWGVFSPLKYPPSILYSLLSTTTLAYQSVFYRVNIRGIAHSCISWGLAHRKHSPWSTVRCEWRKRVVTLREPYIEVWWPDC